jgi:hypothetical protein
MNTKLEILKYVEKYTDILDEIGNIKDRVLIEDSSKDLFSKINNKLKSRKERLKKPKFEVAIIGLEKAGKSTFANALLKDDYLPQAPNRCTYTTTTIESSKENNRATISFYTKNEFLESFQATCKDIELQNIDFETITLDSFEKILQEKSALFQNSNNADDIRAIIKNRDDIKKYLDKSNEIIESNIKNSIKPFIVDEKIARAVKNINILSNEFKDFDDMVLYDVPGFDSPTKFHMEQAKKYLLRADVVILLVSIADNVSFTKMLADYIKDVKDEDGTTLKRKLIICATKFDFHIHGNKDEDLKGIKERKELLIKECKKFDIYKEENFFLTSPLSYLEGLKAMNSDKAHSKIINLGLNDGVLDIRKRVVDFFNNEAIDVLKDAIAIDVQECKTFLLEFRKNNNTEDLHEKINEEEYDLKIKKINEISKQLLDIVVDRQKFVKEQNDFNIQKSIIEKMETIWLDQIKISDEKRESLIKEITQDNTEKVGEFQSKLRPVIYAKSLELMKKMIAEAIEDKSFNVINSFKEEILKVFNINSEKENKLKEKLSEIIDKHSYNSKSYEPLLDRFLIDIFKIMIEYPIATSKNDERFKAFKESEQSIESLLVFDDSYDRELGSLYAQSLVKKILVHYEDIQFEDIKNKLIQYKDLFVHNLSIDDLASSLMNKKISLRTLDNFIEKSKDKLKNLVADSIIHNISEFAPKNIYAELFDNAQKSHTYIQVQEEINKDIDLLKEIISNIVLKAAKIEKPFINSLNNQIESIRIDLNSEKSELKKLIDTNIRFIARDEYNNLKNDPILNEIIKNISIKIKDAIDTI